MLSLLFLIFIIGCGYFFFILLPLKYLEDYKSFSYKSRHKETELARQWREHDYSPRVYCDPPDLDKLLEEKLIKDLRTH